MIKKLLYIIGMFPLLCVAKGKEQECPRADIEVQYNYHCVFVRGSSERAEKDVTFTLLSNDQRSKFFSRDTEFKDSLQSTPTGKAAYRQILHEGIKRYSETHDPSAMSGVTYRTQLYLFKSRQAREMTSYDYVTMAGYFYYSEPLGEIEWEIGDSVCTILGYECLQATAHYHGRQWTAWFAPEIPLSDGPWKLHGLPGLILAASEPSGHHAFEATGIEATSLPMRPLYHSSRYERTTRLEVLRTERAARDNGNRQLKAMLDIDVKAPSQAPSPDLRAIDYLETDYR